MALSDKNIVITPNIGKANDPKIDFTGATANSSATITLTALPTNGGTLNFAGSVGNLFQISNTGSAATSVVSVPSTVASTSTQTGAFVVTGGVGIGQDLRVGGNIYGTFAGTVPIPITNDAVSTGVNFLVFVSTSTGNVSLKVDAPTGLTFQPSSGNIGIGTGVLPQRLTVAGGNIQLDNNTSLRFKDSSGTGYNVLTLANDNNTYIDAPISNAYVAIRAGTTPTEKLRANITGVGIGGIAPLYPLHVYDTSTKKTITVAASSFVGTRQAGINYRIDSTDFWQTYVDNVYNNNWYLRYNDTLNVFTADTSGNIGIGTSTVGVNITTPTPGRYLEIYAPGTTPAIRLVNDAVVPSIYQITSGIPNISTSGFSIWNESTGLGVFNIDSSGRVTINTQTVSNNNMSLDVWGSIGASAGSLTIGFGGAFMSGSIYSNATYGMLFRAKSTPSASGATFAWATQANSELLRLDPNGNLGFGTTAAFEKFVMLGTANTATHAGLTYNMVINSSNPLTPTNPSGVGGGIALGGIITGTTTATFAILSGVKENTNFNDNAGAFIIGTRANGALVAEAVRVTSGKLVGIGTSTPSYALDVKAPGATAVTARLRSSSGDNNQLRFFGNTANAELIAIGTNVSDGGTGANFDVYNLTNSTNLLRVNSSGNLTVTGYIKLAGGIADASGTGNALNVLVPGGGSFASGATSQTGAIKIRLPQGYTDTMMRMTIKVYTYDGQSFDITCGGYTYNGGLSWLNTFAYLNTRNRGNLNVRFGFDGTYNCIFIGEINTTWSYPQVFVTDFQAGYNSYAFTSWINNWNISFYSTAAFANTLAGQYVTSTITAYPAWTTGSLTNVSQLANDAGYLTGANTIAKYTIGNNGVQPCWIYMGRWNTAQQGYTLRMTITGMQGYNASASQNQTTQIYFKTSNTSSSLSGSTGAFYADGQAYRYGANSNGPQTIRVVQIDQSTYDFYSYWPGLIGQGSMYEVVVSVGTWVNSSTVVTPTGNYYDLAMYVGYTSQSLTALSQLTNDVPFYKSGDNANFNTVNLSNLYWRDSGGTVGNGMLNMTAESQILFNGSPLLGDGVNSDILAFYLPNTAEYYNGTSWTSTTVSAFNDAFRGKVSQRFGGSIVLNTTSQQRIRFTWSNWGYKFWNGIIISSNLQGQGIAITMETSSDGSTWVTQINDVNCGTDWPGYHYVRHIGNNSGSSPWLRITLRLITVNANPAYINNIAITGSYGGYANLFDWDSSRNVTFPGNLYAPTYYDSNNSAYYVDPAGGSVLGGNVIVGQTSVSYTSMDNTSLISTVANNVLHVNGSVQLTTDNSAYVVGRGTASFFRDEEIGFGWGGGWYMTEATYLRVRNDKAVYTGGGAYFNTYYDYNDTAYYADPNGASRFNQLKLIYQSASGLGTTGFNVAKTTLGGLHFNNGIGPSGNGVEAAITFMGDTVDQSQAGIYVHNNNSQGTHMAFATTDSYATGPQIGQYIYNTGQVHFPRSYVSAAGSFRAPIFYDSDNTAYYVDPTSTSYISGLQVLKSTNPINFTSGWSSTPDSVTNVSEIANDISGYQRLMIVGNKSGGGDRRVGIWDRLAVNGGTFTYNFSVTGDAYVSTNIRAPLYYDSDNTNYYVDPASTTILNNLTVNGNLSIGSINPLIQGPLYTYYSGAFGANATQARRFEVARIYQDTVNWKGSGMFKLELHNYYYTGNDYQVWQIGYHGTTAYAHMVDGNAPFGRWAKVTLGTPVQYSGNIYYLPIYVDVRYYSTYYGYISTDWNRITTTSPSVSAGYGAVYIVPTPSGTDITDFTPNYTLYTSDIITSGDSVRAPIFYDTDDTNYYVNPAGTSRLNVIIPTSIQLPQNPVGTVYAGVATQPTYYIGQLNGDNDGWKIYGESPSGTNTGALILQSEDDYDSNESIRFRFKRTYSAYQTSEPLISYFNYVYAIDMRAPIFYDSDNTGYYADIASTSVFNVIQTNGYLRQQNDGGTFLISDVSENNNWLFQENARGWGHFYFNKGSQSGQGFGTYSTVGAETFIIGQGYGVNMPSWTGYNSSSKVTMMFSHYSGDLWAYGRVYSADSLMAPIFYDADNSSFYVNPAGTSVMNGITIGGYSVTTTQYQPIHSGRDFTNGTLVQTNIPHLDYGDPWVIEITGNSYGGLPWSIQGAGYLYYATNINIGFVSNGQPISGFKIIRYNGNLCFWWPRQGYWQGFNVNVYVPYATYPVNRVTSIIDTALPSGYDRAIDVTIYQSYNQYNQANYDVTFNRVYANTDMRTYIYYDWANTGYYLDPNGTSNLAALTTNSSINFYMGSGNRVRVYDTDSGPYVYNAEGTGATVRIGAAWGRPGTYSNTYYTLGAESFIDFYIAGGQKGYIDSNNNLYMYSSVRAPIFYDYNDTTFYVDPASTSWIRYLKVNTSGSASSTRALTIKQEGLSEINFGSYPASWTSALQIQNNNNTDFVWISPLDDGYNARFRTGGSGLDFYTDGGNDTGSYSAFIGSGYVQGIDSIRGPIFYDTNDTSYYCDPNGTSSLNQGFFWGGRVVIRGGSPTLYFRDTDENSAMLHNNSNRLYVLRGGTDSESWSTVNGYWPQYWQLNTNYSLMGGTTEAVYDFRAPIFYDSNNTGYYLDPASTSNLYGLTVNQTINGTAQNAWYVRPYITGASNGSPITGTTSDRNVPYSGMYTYHTYGNTNITPVYFGTGFGWGNGGGGSAEIIANWVNGGNPSGIYWRSLRDCCSNWTNWSRILAAADDPYAANMNQYVRVDDQVNFYDVRAYIFYERSDTGYYMDIGSDSNPYKPTYAAQQRWNISRRATARSEWTSDSNYWTNTAGWGTSAGTWNSYWEYGFGGFDCWGYNTGHPQGTGYVHAQGIQSGLHYATSGGGSGYGWQMVGAADATSNRYWARGKWGGSTSGWLEFVMSGSNPGYTLYSYIMYDASDTSYYFDPNGTSNFNYVTSRSKDRLGLTAKWNTPRSDYTSDSNYWTGSMGWGGNDANTITGWGNGYFDSWGVGTGNNFPQSTSHFVGQQAFHYTYGNGGYGWQMVNGGGSTSVWFRPMWYSPGSWQNFAFYGVNNYSYSFYASIVYDSDDTGYYVNPNSTSNLNYTNTRRVTFIGTGGDSGVGTEAYAIFQEGGSWSYPYPDLRIAYHTGIKIGANPSYNGVRFYSDYDMSTQVMSVNNGSDGLGGNNVYVNYSLQAGSSLRAPIFYDSDNTSYYTDPNSFSRTSNIGTDYLHAYNNQSCNLRSNGASYSGSTSGIGPYIYTDSNNNAAMFAFHKGGYYAVNMGLDADNVIRIGGWSASSNRWQLDMSGNMYAAGNITAYSSDRRLKKNIKIIENPIEMLNQMRGVYFDWEDFVDDLGFNPIDRHDIGVIAQEIQTVIPMAIKPAPFDTGGEGKSESGQNYLTVQIEKIIPVLIEAVKSQQKEIEELKKKLLDHKIE